tara:strand:- start:350 stop:601 length:252 start_codon:yes stop_codon:yes gene_type:complete
MKILKEEVDINENYAPIKNNFSDIDGRRADNRVRYCPKCKNCWEMIRKDCVDTFLFYEDFVSYGKEKIICYKCSNKKNEGALV